MSSRPITGATAVYAVLGRPVRHSGSPALHNAWFAAYGIDARYVALEVAEGREGDAVAAIRTLGLAGANLTVPLKVLAFDRLDQAEPVARLAGAVNTIVRDAGRLVGTNTDVEGFCRAVEAQGVALAGRDAVILGAGGAARAVGVGLALRGADRVRIAARRPDQARAVVDALAPGFPAVRFDVAALDDGGIAGADVCVVATSGRPEAVAALDPRRLAPGAAWVDLNYWDPDPVGLRAAEGAGCTSIDGREMLRWQAALAFERWTGILPRVDPDPP